ncbi:MAG: reverse transcriptase domain-containing protein [Rhodopila sp.]
MIGNSRSKASAMTGCSSRLASWLTLTVRGRRFALRRGIGASVTGPMRIARPTRHQRCTCEAVAIVRAQPIPWDRYRQLKRKFCTIVGGVVSPILANIALATIEERYERWTCHRTKLQAHRESDGITAARATRASDRRRGRCVFYPVRYADDFVVMVSGTQEDALAEKSALAEHLHRSTGLELSPEKTRVTAVTDGFEFLGFHVTMRWDKRYGYGPRVEIPKQRPLIYVERSRR